MSDRRTLRVARGFTLIELLIVVAIIAILSAATLGALVSPLREHVRTNIQQEMDAGIVLTLGQITRDVQRSSSVDVVDRGIRLTSGLGDALVVYTLTDDGGLRRHRIALPADSVRVPQPHEGTLVLGHLVRASLTSSQDGRSVIVDLRTEREFHEEVIFREARWTIQLLPMNPEVNP